MASLSLLRRAAPSLSRRLTTPLFTVRYLSDDDATKADSSIDRAQFTVRVPIHIPDLGDSKVLEWFKEEGDVVYEDDVLCDVETPDFTFGLETEDPVAILDEIVVKGPSEILPDNTVIGYLLHPSKESKKED